MAKVTLHATIFGEDGIKTRDYETALIPDAKNQEMQVINLYPDKTYQKIEGFGAALTESAGYALSRMSEENRKKVVEAYYGKDGIGYTIGRIHMDSCDFSIGNYCAVENPDDPEFRDFSLERDAKYVQPLVKAVSKTLGKPVSLLLSPWSPPAFLKETGVRNGGGHLEKESYPDYANYIAKYITEYEKLGLPISWMTVQNEPLAVQTWDSCEYTAEEEKEFLRDYLYPTLKEKGLDHVKLYIWDHNKERTYERTRDIVDETTKDMIAGVAYHWYSGDHFDTLSMVREDYPEIGLATIYRTVQLLLEMQLVDRINLDDGCARYEIGEVYDGKNKHHHHHLICRTCGKITPFKDDLLEELERRIEEEEGFHVLDHELKFYGQCMDCQKKAKQRGEHMEV